VLRWTVELGSADINCEVSMLSLCMVLPRYGHLEQVFNIFAYLMRHHDTEMIYNPSKPVIDMDQFPREDWSYSVYASGGAKLSKHLRSNALEARGEGFVMRLYVDFDYVGDCVTKIKD